MFMFSRCNAKHQLHNRDPQHTQQGYLAGSEGIFGHLVGPECIRCTCFFGARQTVTWDETVESAGFFSELTSFSLAWTMHFISAASSLKKIWPRIKCFR